MTGVGAAGGTDSRSAEQRGRTKGTGPYSAYMDLSPLSLRRHTPCRRRHRHWSGNARDGRIAVCGQVSVPPRESEANLTTVGVQKSLSISPANLLRWLLLQSPTIFDNLARLALGATNVYAQFTKSIPPILHVPLAGRPGNHGATAAHAVQNRANYAPPLGPPEIGAEKLGESDGRSVAEKSRRATRASRL